MDHHGSKTILIVGGGYAGLNAVRALQKQYAHAKQKVRLILVDKEPYHLRKVLLFKAVVGSRSFGYRSPAILVMR
ncbi:hypothetical protein [Paenibacillus oleatilyticus]|uniref:Pyridine nucleotide-disulfide oxidoreductase n=1 Tax=Paenibacillus oleatilyticus TaxID=2594886 RepID=A0ABV4UTA2_9BACL